MKLLAVALFAITSFSTFAQSDMDIQRKIDRLNMLSQRGEVSRLSFMEKRDLEQTLSTALRILRDNDDRRPGPGGYGPGPGPGGYGPGPGNGNGFPGGNGGGGRGRRFDVQATIVVSDPFGKSAAMNLGGRNPGDILGQCISQYPSLGLSNVSRIVMTSNNNPYETVRVFTSNANDLCTQIVNRMKPSRPDWQYIDVSGTFSDPFNATGILNLNGDRGEVLEQCLDQVGRARMTNISKLTLSINRSALIEKRIFTSSAGDTCAELATVLNQQAP